MPMTSYPSDFKSAAVADESTPPDMATTILVSCGRPSRSRLLSMVPSSMRPLRPRLPRDQEALEHALESGFARAAEKLCFNIGRIPHRQITLRPFAIGNGKSCRRAEKGPARSSVLVPHIQLTN